MQTRFRAAALGAPDECDPRGVPAFTLIKECSQRAQRRHLRAHSQACHGLGQLSQLRAQTAPTTRRTAHLAIVFSCVFTTCGRYRYYHERYTHATAATEPLLRQMAQRHTCLAAGTADTTILTSPVCTRLLALQWTRYTCSISHMTEPTHPPPAHPHPSVVAL